MNEAYATLRIQLRNRPGLHNFTLKVDTGAQANTMPFRTFRDMFPEQLDRFGNPCTDCLQPTESILTTYNGTGIACSGTAVAMTGENGETQSSLWPTYPELRS